MADIELVIKISEKTYAEIMAKDATTKAEAIICNGTPIDKYELCVTMSRAFANSVTSVKILKDENDELKNKINNIIDAIDFATKATDSRDDYDIGMRNGMRYVKSLIDGKEPQYELRQTDDEIKLGIDLGDEVVGDYGAKGVVVGIDTHKEAGVMLSLLMGNYKVPQLVHASNYKTKTGRHFPQIREVLEQIKGEADEDASEV